MEQRFAFVLRIWLNDSPSNRPAGGVLHGTLQAVDASEPLRFNSLRQLHELLESALKQDDTPPSVVE